MKASPKWYLIFHQPKLLVARTSTSSPALYDNSSSLFALYDSRATQYPDERKKKNYTGLLNFRWAVKRGRLDTTVTWKFVLRPFFHSLCRSFVRHQMHFIWVSMYLAHFTCSSEPHEDLVVCRATQYLNFSDNFRPWVLVPSPKSNTRPPAV